MQNEGVAKGDLALSSQLSTLSPQLSALSPQLSALNSQPSTLNPQLSALSSQPSTLSSQLSTLHLFRALGEGDNGGSQLLRGQLGLGLGIVFCAVALFVAALPHVVLGWMQFVAIAIAVVGLIVMFAGKKA